MQSNERDELTCKYPVRNKTTTTKNSNSKTLKNCYVKQNKVKKRRKRERARECGKKNT